VNSSPVESFTVSVNPQPLGKSGKLNVNLKLDTYSGVEMALYDLTGKKVFSKDRAYFSAGEHSISLDQPSLASGTYMLEIRRDNGQERIVKVVAE
jgi:hypothetical protein